MEMTGKEKLYFLLNTIEDKRILTASGQPLLIHPAGDLQGHYPKTELLLLLKKLEDDEKILRVTIMPKEPGAWDYYHYEYDYYGLELLPAFDDYFVKIQNEPEYQEFSGKKPTKKQSSVPSDLSMLHPEIFNKCQDPYEKGLYAEAVEKGFKIVRDKLRELTSYETGSEAFGKGKLHIKGASAPNVDNDFNNGVKFLTMAIDMFKNEKGHTSKAKIDDPKKAYEYLTLSSLAMNLLDQAEISNS